jgi:tetratricopeptide (TPR) repeat protein
LEEAMTELEDLKVIAPADSMSLQGHISRIMANIQGAYGRVERARELYERAEANFAAGDDWIGVALALHGQGWMHVNSCNFDAAHNCYVRGRLAAQQGRDQRQEAWCIMGIGESLNRQGNPESEAFCQLAYDSFERLGVRIGMALALAALGDCARRRGAHAIAAERYLQTREIATKIQHFLVHYSHYLLSLNEIQQGHIEEAAREIEHILLIQNRFADTSYICGAYAVAMTIAAARADQLRWDSYKILADQRSARGGNALTIDHVELYESSKLYWERANDPLRAGQALVLSQTIARELGMSER